MSSQFSVRYQRMAESRGRLLEGIDGFEPSTGLAGMRYPTRTADNTGEANSSYWQYYKLV